MHFSVHSPFLTVVWLLPKPWQGLLGRVHESTQNVLGSLAAASSPPSPVRLLSPQPSPATRPPAAQQAAPARPANNLSGEETEMARLRHEISRAMRALAAAGSQPRGQALSVAPPPAARGSEGKTPKRIPEVNPEEQLQGLKKLAREWIGYRGGLAVSPKPVLCPALSPRRFRSPTCVPSPSARTRSAPPALRCCAAPCRHGPCLQPPPLRSASP